MQHLTCARVGFGHVAQIHENKFKDLGVQTIAILDTNLQKQEEAKKYGFNVLTSFEEVAAAKPLFWDICVNTDQHFQVLQTIFNISPNANVLVEKPICDSSQIDQLQNALSAFNGKIAVNENYASSTIVKAVKKIAFDKLKIQPQSVIVEFTKNREADVVGGRFIDSKLGVLGYEGSHMLAVLAQLGAEYEISHVVDAQLTLAKRRSYPAVSHQHQTDAYFKCKTVSGIDVELHTSMMGHIKFPYFPFSVETIPSSDRLTRHRVLSIHGYNNQGDHYDIIGFFEPITQFERSKGAVIIMRNGYVANIIAPIHDDCMGFHLKQTLRYFLGAADNPYTPAEAFRDIGELYRLSDEAKKQSVFV